MAKKSERPENLVEICTEMHHMLDGLSYVGWTQYVRKEVSKIQVDI